MAVIFEIHLIDNEWRVDFCATRHVCKNEVFFKTLKEEDGYVIYVENTSCVQVKGKGIIEIKFTSG